MHDIDDLERRGIPSVFVASDPFRDGAQTQAEALGLNVSRVFVEHPIQDRTDDEMRDLANRALAELLAAITGPN